MKFKIAVIFVVALASFLRIYDFGSNPAGVFDDQASIGYNAYSLAQTGKDEYGKEWPIFFKSFGTYASSLYTYLTVIPIKLFGLSETTTHLVSLLAGLILVVISIRWLGLMTGLIIAISPIFIFFSRSAFESNLATTLIFGGVLLAVYAAKKPHFLIISFAVLSISAYAYHAARFMSLFLICYFTIYFWFTSKSSRKVISVSLLIAFIIQIPLLLVSLTPGANIRLTGLTHQGSTIESIGSSLRLYLAYFSPNNLFSKGDPEPHRSFVQLSVFYWWMIFPLIAGIYKIIKDKSWKSLIGQTLLLLIFVSPIPGAITKDYYSTIRVMPMFIGLSWVIAQGARQLTKSWIVYGVFILLAVLELYSNLIIHKYEKATAFGYEYKALVLATNKLHPQTIVVDNARLKSTYVYFAFYNSVDPHHIDYQRPNWNINNYYYDTYFDGAIKVRNVETRPIIWQEDIYKQQILVGDTLTISDDQANEHSLEHIITVSSINGDTAFRLFKTNPTNKCASAKAKLTPTEKLHPSCID